jgi:membrane protein required for beta-lactamase induction
MRLLIVLITTAADKLLGESLAKFKALRRLDWYHRLVGWIEQKVGSVEVFKGPIGVAAMLALPLLVFWFLLSWIGGWHGILAFLLAITILLYCLGPEDLDDQVRALIAAIRGGNDAEANRLAQALGRSAQPVSAETLPAETVDPGNRDPIVMRSAQPVSAETRGDTVVESILTEFPERVFGVLLWFLILGPIGAVLFRFSAELRRYAMQASSGLRDWAGRVYNVLAWLPSRIVALGYALSGNLTGAFERWRVLDTLTLEQNETALRMSGTGALQIGSDAGEVERITAAQGLVTRTLIVLLAVLTVLYLIAWIT